MEKGLTKAMVGYMKKGGGSKASKLRLRNL